MRQDSTDSQSTSEYPSVQVVIRWCGVRSRSSPEQGPNESDGTDQNAASKETQVLLADKQTGRLGPGGLLTFSSSIRQENGTQQGLFVKWDSFRPSTGRGDEQGAGLAPLETSGGLPVSTRRSRGKTRITGHCLNGCAFLPLSATVTNNAQKTPAPTTSSISSTSSTLSASLVLSRRQDKRGTSYPF